MYQVSGKIYEQHGEYKCFLEVWNFERSTAQIVFNFWEEHLVTSGEASDEHEEILSVLMTALSRIAEKHERPIF